MNCLLAGRPSGSTLGVARALLASAPQAPVTLMSDDTQGLLAVLDEPGLTGCEVLWADAASPATLDDALVHRRMLHGGPDVVVIAVDEASERDRALVAALVPRLSGAPLVLTGHGATILGPEAVALLHGSTDDDAAAEPAPIEIVAGDDPRAVLARAARLLREAPAHRAEAPLLRGHCAH